MHTKAEQENRLNTEDFDRLAHTLFVNCGRALAQALDEQDLLQSVCNTLVNDCGFRLAWVGLTEPGTSNSIRLVAQAGDQDGFLQEPRCSETPATLAIQAGESCCIKAIVDSPLVVPIRAAALKRGYTSVLSLPLKSDGKLFGALTIYADDPGKLDERIIERLRQWLDLFALRVKTLRSHEERDGSDSLNNDLQNIAARQRLENRLRLIIDTTPALIHTSRPDGYLDYFNKRWVEYLGVSLDDVEGWKWTASVHPDDVAGIVGKWRACLASGEIFEYETRVRQADGEYRRMLHRKVPLRDEHGKILKWYGSSMDIEDYKRAEEQLRRSAEELQRSESYLAEGQRLAQMGSWAFDAAGFDYWSPELFRMHGLEPASKAPTVQEYLDCVHPQDRAFMAELIKRILAEPSRFDITKRVVRPDGEVRYIRCVGTPVVENQALKKFVGTAIDVTEYELLTQELRRSKAHLTNAQTLSRTGSVGMEVSTKRIFWSEESARIYGYPSGTQPTPELILQRVHPDDVGLVKDVFERAAQGGHDFEFEHRLLMPDGSIKHIFNLSQSVRDEVGNEEVVGAIMDVTEHKLAEEAIRHSEAFLAEAQRLSHTGSFGWRPDAGEIVWSDETYRIFEYDRALKPTIELVVQRVHPEDRVDFHDVIDRSSRGATHFEHAYRLLLPNGRVKHVHALAHASLDTSGNREFVGAVMDVTGRKRAEEAVLRSEKELRNVIETIPISVWTASPDGTVDFVSRHWREHSDLSAEGSFGTGWQTALHPEDVERHLDKWRAALATGAPFENEARGRAADGEYRWFLARAVPLRDEQGNILKWYGITMEIDDRKRAEEAVRASEHRFRLAVESIPGLVSIMNAKGEIEVVNGQVLNYFGKTLEEVKSWGTTDAVHPDDLPRVLAEWKYAVETEQPYDIEHRLRRADGMYRWFHARGLPLRDDEGRIVRWYNLLTDTDDRKKAEEKLRRSEASLLDAQRLSRTGSWTHDLSSGTVTISPEAVRMWGIQTEDNAAVTDFFLARIHPEDRLSVEQAYKEARVKKADFESEFRIVLPDGTIKNIHSVGRPIVSESGDIVEFVGAAIDITERKQAEEEHQAHLWFLESMDQVNRAIQGTNDLEHMMSDVLDAVLAIFNCDRAWLVYPCDPEAASWKVSMEHVRPEFPGAFALGLVLPVVPDVAKMFQTVRASSSPVRFGPASEHSLPAETAKRFSIQSIIAMAVHPKTDKPYMLGLHQCSYPRVWTSQEERLFQEIGRRLEDALTSLLMFRNRGESERKLEEAQRLAHVGYWERDTDTDLITWSDETYRIFGLQPQARNLNPAQLPELVHPEDKQIVTKAVAEALRGGPRYDVEYRVVRPNGEVRLVHNQGDVMWNESGRPRRMFGTVQDITERKQAEQRLVAQHTVTQILAQAATLQEATPKILQAVCECLVWDVGALWSLDKEAGVLRCVEVWHKESIEVPQFEVASRETTFIPGIGLPGRVWFSREPMYIPDVVRDANFPRAPIAAREVLHAAFGFPILLGGEVLGVVEFFSYEIRQPDQDLLDMMATIGSQIGQFIERKRAEEAFRSAQIELAHVTRVATLGEMTASIAHEINQPLGALVNNAGACLGWLDAENLEEARNSVALMMDDAQRASEIITRIRALVKKAPPQKDWLDINQTIREVIGLAQSEVQRNHVALETQLSDDMPLVFGDRIQLQQVMLNLMMNAIEAMSQVTTPRELLISSGADDSKGVVVVVRDSGPGLDSKSLERLFEPFYTTKPQGMGMGLAICRSIMQAHGGRLWAATNRDRGASFHFSLPTSEELE